MFDKLKILLKKSYAPYSKFNVAAIVETDKGAFSGVNIENSSFGATICAERVAIFSAITAGAYKFKNLYLITSSENEIVMPCALCLQVMSNFFDQNVNIICYSYSGKKKIYKFKDLLPVAFTKNTYKKAK
jgi:cytidine deaminase